MCVCVRARVGRVGARARGHVHVASLIQHAMRMSHIVTSFAASLAPPHFSTLSHKWRDFRKKLLYIKCEFRFSLQILTKTFLSATRI